MEHDETSHEEAVGLRQIGGAKIGFTSEKEGGRGAQTCAVCVFSETADPGVCGLDALFGCCFMQCIFERSS